MVDSRYANYVHQFYHDQPRFIPIFPDYWWDKFPIDPIPYDPSPPSSPQSPASPSSPSSPQSPATPSPASLPESPSEEASSPVDPTNPTLTEISETQAYLFYFESIKDTSITNQLLQALSNSPVYLNIPAEELSKIISNFTQLENNSESQNLLKLISEHPNFTSLSSANLGSFIKVSLPLLESTDSLSNAYLNHPNFDTIDTKGPNGLNDIWHRAFQVLPPADLKNTRLPIFQRVLKAPQFRSYWQASVDFNQADSEVIQSLHKKICVPLKCENKV
jgi:hypothetical protein